MRIPLISKEYRAEIETLGAELKSFRSPSGQEFVWNSDPAHWPKSSPLLFPTIGNVRNDRTVIEGVTYEMPKHGFCKVSEFEVTEQSESSVTLTLSDSPETLRFYPYAFTLSLTYRLFGSRLVMEYRVLNKDTREMFYHIGAHPGFFCPMHAGEDFRDYALFFENDETLSAHVYDLERLCFSSARRKEFAPGRVLPLTVEMFDDDAVYFRHTASHRVSLLHTETKKGVEVYYPDFSSVAFWTPAGGNAPFLCIEPWNGSGIFDDEDDIFAHKRDIKSLPAGEAADYRLEIALIE